MSGRRSTKDTQKASGCARVTACSRAAQSVSSLFPCVCVGKALERQHLNSEAGVVGGGDERIQPAQFCGGLLVARRCVCGPGSSAA